MSKQRIISLLPSCTEIVYALGCGNRLVGRSHECDFPPEVRRLPVCSRAKINTNASSNAIDQQVKALLEQALSIYEVDTAKIKELRPDIILTQAQCEVCAVSEADLQKALADTLNFDVEIISLSPRRFADLWTDMTTVARALGVFDECKETIQGLKARVVAIIEKTCMMKKRPSVACIEWLDPLMSAGNWIPEMVDLAGGNNLFGSPGKHSPWMTWEEIVKADPEILVIFPCGFDLERTHRELDLLKGKADWQALRAVRSGKVFIADGSQYFNRPGPRLVDSLESLAQMLHPEIFKYDHGGWERL